MTSHSPIRRIAVVATLLRAGGCDKLGLGDGKSPTTPSAPPVASTIVYNAVGASDANGVGSSVPCIPFDNQCDGMGYVSVATRQLRAQGVTVVLSNHGVPTSVGRDVETLGQQFDRTILTNFIESEMPFVDSNSTVVTIFAGINVDSISSSGGARTG